MQFTDVKLQRFLMINKNDISIKFNENLQDYCTFKIGGPVKYLIFVYSCNSDRKSVV